jgi:hypothetical protein
MKKLLVLLLVLSLLGAAFASGIPKAKPGHPVTWDCPVWPCRD